jgi:VWFA-related protein
MKISFLRTLFSLAFVVALLFSCNLFGQKEIDVEVMVSLVNVWVRATDSAGAAVKGLTSADFELSEDGKPVAIDCLEEVNADKNQSNPAAAVPAVGQRFVLYLDLLNTNTNDFAFMKSRLQDFLDQIATRNSEVMVVALMPSGKLRIVSPYTTYLPQVKLLVDQAKGNTDLAQEAINNERDLQSILERLEVEDPITTIDELVETAFNGPREKNSQTLRAAMNLVRTITTTQKNRAELTLAALGSLGVYLARKGEDAHTIILYVSGGIYTDPGRHYIELVEHAAEQKGMLQNRQVFSIRVGQETSQTFDVHGLVRNTIGILNRLNITLYSVSTRGLPTSVDAAVLRSGVDSESFKTATDYQGSLVQMANETGGLPFVNSSNFKVGFDSIFEDLQHSYLLCYYRPDHDEKKFHEIKLKCKKAGTNLRYRTGYID